MEQVKRTMGTEHWAKIVPKFNKDNMGEKSRLFEDIEGYFRGIGKKIKDLDESFPKTKRGMTKKERQLALESLMCNSCR